MCTTELRAAACADHVRYATIHAMLLFHGSVACAQLVRNAISSGYEHRKDTKEIVRQVVDIIRSTPRTVFKSAALQQMLVQCVRHGIIDVCGDILNSFAGSSRPLSVKEAAQILLALPQCHGIEPVAAANLVDHITEFTNFGQSPAEAHAAETYFRSRMR